MAYSECAPAAIPARRARRSLPSQRSSRLRMILSQFEEAVWHRRGSDCDIAEAWHHGGEIVSAVETVLEFGEVAGYMLVADGAVSASDGALDVAKGGVDPLEGRVQGWPCDRIQ